MLPIEGGACFLAGAQAQGGAGASPHQIQEAQGGLFLFLCEAAFAHDGDRDFPGFFGKLDGNGWVDASPNSSIERRRNERQTGWPCEDGLRRRGAVGCKNGGAVCAAIAKAPSHRGYRKGQSGFPLCV